MSGVAAVGSRGHGSQAPHAGDDPGGVIVTIFIGVAGAFVGGFVVGLLGGRGVSGLNIWSILVATLGAVILFAVYRLLASRRVS